ncbi:hypothetical protein D9M69_417570 [compost metagenome]
MRCWRWVAIWWAYASLVAAIVVFLSTPQQGAVDGYTLNRPKWVSSIRVSTVNSFRKDSALECFRKDSVLESFRIGWSPGSNHRLKCR